MYIYSFLLKIIKINLKALKFPYLYYTFDKDATDSSENHIDASLLSGVSISPDALKGIGSLFLEI
jgi:hypothetical protein